MIERIQGTQTPAPAKPEQVSIETARLSLTPLRAGDLDDFIAVFADRNSARMTHAIPHPLSREDAERLLSDMSAAKLTHWAIRDESERLVGVVSLTQSTCGKPRGMHSFGPNLSVFVAPAHQGRGYALEAIDGLLRWVKKRKAAQPPIHVIAAFEKDTRTTRAFQLRPPDNTSHVIVDTPAALTPAQLPDMVRDAAKIIVPVLPSDIDIHAASRCIADLLLVAKIKRAENRIGVVANRVRKNTLMFQALMRFLEKLDIPVIATVRDSQNYVRAAEQGVGIHEMKAYTVKEDLAQWQGLLAWLEPERVLAEQPPPMQEQPAPQVTPNTAEAVIESGPDETGAHDARFVLA